jgi:carbon-monoxide dehydrogenase medium subunit
MNPFELAEPASLAEAIALLDPADPSIRPVAGGTAIMLMLKTGLFRPTKLVSLRRIEKRYAHIQATPEGGLSIGAMTPLARIERSPEVAATAPVITRTLRTLSNVRVRNVATVGGHLAHADPHTDLPPVLIALGASVRAVGPKGEREIAVERLAKGYLETVLGENELIAELRSPPQPNCSAVYLKCTTRSADDWPALGVAASLEMAGETVRAARLALGAAADTPVRLAAAEAAITSASSYACT